MRMNSKNVKASEGSAIPGFALIGTNNLEESKDEIRGIKENVNNRSFKEDYTERSIAQRLPKNAEEFVVPAHNMKKPIDFNTVGEEDFNGEGYN